MQQKHITQMNEFSRHKQPFVALISFDTPENDMVCALKDAKKQGISFRFQAAQSASKQRLHYALNTFPVAFSVYQQAFKRVKQYIKNGECYLFNLCFPTPIQTDLSLKQIYQYSSAPLVLMLKNQFVCFTPEKFVTIKKGKITTYPMKGTINAKLKNAKKILRKDEKELSEQTLITDLMRNDINKVTHGAKVEKFRYFEKIHTKKGAIWQTSSKISGSLKTHYAENLGDLFANLLPAGSITGTPKRRVCQLIEQIEHHKRGFYTGVFIHYDGKVCKSFVLIRFVGQNADGQLYFFSGGGITVDSQAKKEFNELKAKTYFTF